MFKQINNQIFNKKEQKKYKINFTFLNKHQLIGKF